jgi:hypothetical protein
MHDQELRAWLHELAGREWNDEERQILYGLDYLLEVLRSRRRDRDAEQRARSLANYLP